MDMFEIEKSGNYFKCPFEIKKVNLKDMEFGRYYQTGYEVRAIETRKLLFYTYNRPKPLYKKSASMWLNEFNPSRLQLRHPNIIDWLSPLCDLQKAKLRRLDTKSDLTNHSHDRTPFDIMEWTVVRGKHRGSWTIRDGTAYIGDGRCDQTAKYNATLKDLELRALEANEFPNPNGFYETRLERRMKHKKIPIQSIFDFHKLLDWCPFNNLKYIKPINAEALNWMVSKGYGTLHMNPQAFANYLSRSHGIDKYSQYFDPYPINDLCNMQFHESLKYFLGMDDDITTTNTSPPC